MQFDFFGSDNGGPFSQNITFPSSQQCAADGVARVVYALFLAEVEGVKQVGTGTARLKIRWTEKGSAVVREHVSDELDLSDPDVLAVVSSFSIFKKAHVDVDGGAPGPATHFDVEFERTGEGGAWDAEIHVK